MRNTIALIGLFSLAGFAEETAKPELKFSGDVRARGEWFYQEYTDPTAKAFPNTERFSQVLRARLGATATQGAWTAGLRIVTGTGSPTSSNTTEGNAKTGNDFQSKPVYLDRAYLNMKWSGGTVEALDWKTQIQFGKFANPLIKGNNSNSELIFGNDLCPEGAFLGAEMGNSILRITGNTGRFWIDEIELDRGGKGDKPDVFLQSQQLVLDMSQKGFKVRIGGGSHYYNDMLNHQVFGSDTTANFGNTTNAKSVGSAAKIYATNFNLIEAFTDISLTGNVPLTLSGSYVKNLEDDDNKTNDGFIASVKLGAPKKADEMEINYAFRYSGANSAVGFTSSPDFGGGKTNSMGSIISMKYLLTSNLSADLIWHAFNKINIRDTDKEETLNKVRVELNAYF